jgi:hypothetical protein
MSDWNLPIVLSEILSRFPQNIIDRLITAFAGFGIALLLQVISKKLRVKNVVVRERER